MIWGVHLSDGVIEPVGWITGWIIAAVMLAWSARGLDDRTIPRVGLMTAVVFVASQIHLPLGFTSVHLLLNGVVGVTLRRHAPVALAVGLAMQSWLFSHGGPIALGLNIVIYSIPALLAGFLVPSLVRSEWLHRPAIRFLAVFLVTLLWLATVTLAIQSLGLSRDQRLELLAHPVETWLTVPGVITSIVGLAIAAGFAERWLERDPNFAVGLLLGAGTAYLTIGLNSLVLSLAAIESVQSMAGIVWIVNLPVIAVESVAVGFTVPILIRAGLLGSSA